VCKNFAAQTNIQPYVPVVCKTGEEVLQDGVQGSQVLELYRWRHLQHRYQLHPVVMATRIQLQQLTVSDSNQW